MGSRLVLAAIAAIAAPSVVSAEIGADNFSAVVTLTSDYVFRGISQSRGNSAIQGGFDFDHGSGIFAGVWASSVQLYSTAAGRSARALELDYYLGYRFELGEDWGGHVVATRYTYPGSEPASHYDYGEIDLSLGFKDTLAASFSYSDDVYGLGKEGSAYELIARLPILDSLETSVGVGHHDLDAPFGNGYFYWHVGLAGFLGSFTLSASYIDTDSNAAAIWGRERSAGRLAVSVSATIH